MKILHNTMIPPENMPLHKTNESPAADKSVDFQSILSGKIDVKALQFSKHANTRLDARDIELSPEQIRRVENGVKTAGTKGIKDSLVLVDNVALVVNIKNNVVVTAMNPNNENIFTNIDGAVIV